MMAISRHKTSSRATIRLISAFSSVMTLAGKEHLEAQESVFSFA
jgi:hypothetical protein